MNITLPVRIYLDDERQTPVDFPWVRVFSASQAINLLEACRNVEVPMLSLDHDLGDDEDGTGYTVISWLEERAYFNDWAVVPDAFQIHSANPVGRKRMQQVIDNIEKMRKIRKAIDF